MKKLSTRLFRIGLICLFTFLLFEAIFRIYIVDFYGAPFKYLNKEFSSKQGAQELVIIGDSFSAFKDGYAKILHDSLATYNVSNISIPGTSIREQFLFGRHYLKSKKPDVLVFQYYVGNDLFGWRHPMNWEDISFARNLYWCLSERFWSMSYINYKLAGLKPTDIRIPERISETGFSPELYTMRDKMYFRAEPYMVENSLLLKNGRAKDLEEYMARMEKLFAHAPDYCKIYVLVIPHAAQISQEYVEKFKSIGGKFSEDFRVGDKAPEYLIQLKKRFANDYRIKWVDPLGLLIASEALGEPVYFSNDSHLNNNGQRLVGDFLLDQMLLANED